MAYQQGGGYLPSRGQIPPASRAPSAHERRIFLANLATSRLSQAKPAPTSATGGPATEIAPETGGAPPAGRPHYDIRIFPPSDSDEVRVSLDVLAIGDSDAAIAFDQTHYTVAVPSRFGTMDMVIRGSTFRYEGRPVDLPLSYADMATLRREYRRHSGRDPSPDAIPDFECVPSEFRDPRSEAYDVRDARFSALEPAIAAAIGSLPPEPRRALVTPRIGGVGGGGTAQPGGISAPFPQWAGGLAGGRRVGGPGAPIVSPHFGRAARPSIARWSRAGTGYQLGVAAGQVGGGEGGGGGGGGGGAAPGGVSTSATTETGLAPVIAPSGPQRGETIATRNEQPIERIARANYVAQIKRSSQVPGRDALARWQAVNFPSAPQLLPLPNLEKGEKPWSAERRKEQERILEEAKTRWANRRWWELSGAERERYVEEASAQARRNPTESKSGVGQRR